MAERDLALSLERVLQDTELAAALEAAARPLTREELERSLTYQADEIGFEVSRATSELEAAQAAYRERRSDFVGATGNERLLGMLGFGLLGGVAVGILFGLAELLHWPLRAQILSAWPRVWGEGWLALLWWVLLALSLALSAWAIDGLFRRLPALRRRLKTELQLSELEARMNAARAAAEAATDKVVREYVYAHLNDLDRPPYQAQIFVGPDAAVDPRDLTRAFGLAEVPERGQEVPTAARNQILVRLEALPGASLGISGPRGVGKSTLLASLCDANPEIKGRRALAINTAAPVEYDAREFLLHLFSSLCRQVLRTEGAREPDSPAEEALAQSRAWQTASIRGRRLELARMLCLAGFLLLVVGAAASVAILRLNHTQSANQVRAAAPRADALYTSAQSAASGAVGTGAAAPVGKTPSELLGLQPGPMLLLGGICVLFGLVLAADVVLFRRRARLGFGSSRYRMDLDMPHRLEFRSRAELQNIRFQRSYTSGWSGGLRVPVGMDLSVSGGLSLAQQPESLPELVERYKAYVRILVERYGRVIIGIDELDKLRSSKEAETFLNGIKAVFGIPGCFYLISVSEQALSAFERRGLGFRDAFDSALDDVCQVSYADLAGSRALLARRVLRLPEPHLHLCHMLSGGLPRDLIRHVRNLLELAAARGPAGLSVTDAAAALLRMELEAKVRATSIALRQLEDGADITRRLLAVAELAAYGADSELAARVTTFKGTLASEQQASGRAALLCEELATYGDLLLAIQEVAQMAASETGWARVQRLQLTEAVTAARQGIEVSPALASAALSRWRRILDEDEQRPPPGASKSVRRRRAPPR